MASFKASLPRRRLSVETLEQRRLLAGTITGTLRVDADGDGLRDLNETSGIVGRTVYLNTNNNGQLNAGEPTTITAADDPATPTIDEAGTYEFAVENFGTYHVSQLGALGWQSTSPVKNDSFGHSGSVTSIQTTSSTGDRVFASPDGNHVYTIDRSSVNGLSVLTRDWSTGMLSPYNFPFTGFGMEAERPFDAAFSPDSRWLVVSENVANRVKVYERTGINGNLTLRFTATNDVGGFSGLQAPEHLAISKDGQSVYVYARGSGMLSRFSLNQSTGELSQTQSVSVTTAANLSSGDLVVTPDGTQVLLADQFTNRVYVYSRDLVSGSLALSQTLVGNTSVAAATGTFNNPLSIAVSPNGNYVYVASGTGRRVDGFTRNPTTGAIATVSTNGFFRSTEVTQIAISPDGLSMIEARRVGNSTVVSELNPTTGAMSSTQFLQYSSSPSTNPNLQGIEGVSFSPDGRHVYTAAPLSSRLGSFRRTVGDLQSVSHTVTITEATPNATADFLSSNPVPRVGSFTITSGTPYNSPTQTFTLTMTEPVTGVDASDFEIVSSTVTGATISVTGSGTSYVVTVDVGNNSGYFNFRLVDNDSIIDAGGAPLSGAGFGTGNPGDGSVTINNVYVDRVVPTVVSVVAESPLHNSLASVTYLVTFSEDVYSYVGKYSINQIGSTGAAVSSIQYIGVGQYRVTITTGSGNGTIQLRLIDDDTIRDSSNNLLGGVGTGTEVLDAPTYNVELNPLRSIVGTLYSDDNRDGQPTAGEVGVSGLRVYSDTNGNAVWNTGEPFMFTDVDGDYELPSLPLNTYNVRVESTVAWVKTTASTSAVILTLASPPQTEVPLGVEPNLTAITGVVFDDLDANGTREVGEAGYAGATVFVDTNSNGVLNAGEVSIVTPADDPATIGIDESGMFSFSQLPLGTSRIVVIRPTGFISTSPGNVNVVLAQSTDTADVAFAIHENTTRISGTLFNDLNADGTQDNGEGPLSGFVVYIDTNNNRTRDAGEPHQTTEADGGYVFDNVSAGQNIVRVVTGSQWMITSPDNDEERLFVSSGPVVAELNPYNGNVLNSFTLTPVPTRALQSSGLAFDGASIYILDRIDSVIYKVDANTGAYSGIFNSLPTSALFGGLAYVGSTLYAMDNTNERIFSLNPNTGAVLQTLNIPALNVGNPIFTGAIDLLDGLGESADGTKLLAGTIGEARLVINPGTGIIEGVFTDPANVRDTGIAGGTGRVFISRNSSNNYQVYDGAGVLVDTLPNQLFGVPFPNNIAAALVPSSAAILNVALDQQISDVNFGLTSTLATISGTVTAGSAYEGARVYVDLDNDRQLDAGEPNAITAADGTYTITDVAAGDYTVRQVPLPGRDVVVVGSEETRLFLYRSNNQVDSTIIEIDPQTGATLQQFPAPGVATQPTGLAMSGGRIYMAKTSSMYVIDPDSGQLVDEFAIPSGNNRGLAILGSVAYLHDPTAGTLKAFNLGTRQLTNSISLVQAIPGYTFNGQGGLGEAPDGQSLVITIGNNAFQIDPATGTVINPLGLIYTNGAIASAGGELFEPHIYSGGVAQSIAVRDGAGQLIRVLPIQISNSLDGLGAQSGPATAHPISVNAFDDLTGIDFENVSNTGTISGVQFVDANQNGVFDGGELPLPGVTVFVDLDANGFPDIGEPQTVSQSDGTYTLTDVPAGNALVRTVTPAHYRPTVVNSSADRMFATGRVTNASSSTGSTLEIRELDPATGGTLSLLQTNLPTADLSNMNQSTAFDGKQLVIADNQLRSLFEVARDGTLLRTTPLPMVGTEKAFVYGPVIARGSVYVLARGGIGGINYQWIYRFDSETAQFVERKALTYVVSPGEATPVFGTTLSESVDGQSIIAFASDTRAFTIDPATGRTTRVDHLPETNGFEFVATVVGQELFLGSAGTNGTLVYDANWQLQRIMPANFSRQGFGGGLYEDSGQVVSVTEGQTSSGVSFGYRSTLATVSGQIVNEADSPIVGAEVFLDANRNAVFDAGEVSVTTDATGAYAFAGVAPGDHSVRVVTTSDQRSVLAGQTPTRLFTTQSGSGVGPTVIREIDPLTGVVVNSFDAPEDTGNVGLALDQYALYFAVQDDLYSLDPDTGEVLAYLELPDGNYTGAAVVGGHVFVLDPTTNVILKIEPLSQTVVATFNSPFDLTGTLGESFDGTKLVAAVSGNGVVEINANDGSQIMTGNILFMGNGFGTAAGEHYFGSSGNIQIRNEQNAFLRRLANEYAPAITPSGLAVAQVPHGEARLHLGVDEELTGIDFVVRSGFDTSDIALSATSINENISTAAADVLFAELSAVDASPIQQFGYALISGPGDDDNGKFVIVGNELRIKRGEVIDFETQSTFQVRVLVGDASGVLLEKAITLSVNNLIEITKSNVVINSGAGQRSRVDSVTVTFDTDVILQPGAITVTKRGAAGGLAGVVSSPLPGTTARTFTLTFAGAFVEFGSLRDGNYELKIDADKVLTPAGLGLDSNQDGATGDDFTFGDDSNDRFFRLLGDSNGDRDVDALDFLAFRRSFGVAPGSSLYRSYFDERQDGDVDALDFLAFRRRFGSLMLF